MQACDAAQGKDGQRVLSAILPVLLDTGITNLVKEVRSVRSDITIFNDIFNI